MIFWYRLNRVILKKTAIKCAVIGGDRDVDKTFTSRPRPQVPMACKNMGGWWRWALVSLDGVAPSRMVSVSASVNLPLHHRVQKFFSGTGSPGWGRKMVVVVVIMIDYWLIEQWSGAEGLIDCWLLIVWLMNWFIDELIVWLVDELIVWLIDWSQCPGAEGLIDWWIDLLIDELIIWLIDWWQCPGAEGSPVLHWRGLAAGLSTEVSSAVDSSPRWGQRGWRLRHRIFWWGGHERNQGRQGTCITSHKINMGQLFYWSLFIIQWKTWHSRGLAYQL